MNWIKPIFDRSNADIQYAKAYLIEVSRLGKWPLDPETNQPRHLKGCLNFSDLNRIENNNGYLVLRIEELLGENVTIPNTRTNWDETHIVTTTDFTRIINSLSEIVGVFTKGSFDFPTPDELSQEVINEAIANINFELLNLLEKTQFEIYEALRRIETTYLLSDTFKSDQKQVLPKKILDRLRRKRQNG